MAKRSIIFLNLLICLLLLFIAGCAKKKNKSSAQSRGLALCVKERITSLDPRVGISRPSNIVVRMLFEGLMRHDAEGKLINGLAEDYEISDDRMTYTFHLRNCHWSNGDPITAYDFEYAWKRSLDPRFAQPSGYAYYPIKNVSKCFEGKISLDQVGIDAIDEKTLAVLLEHPAPYFLELTSTSPFFPIPKKIAEKNEDWANQENEKLVCNGPFCLSHWKRGKSMQLDKNPHYWNAASVKIPHIKISVRTKELEHVDLFKRRKIDWLGQPLSPFSPEGIERLDHIEYQTSLGLLAYFCNVDEHPLNNKNLRKALAYAINRREIARFVLCEGGIPAQALLNPLLHEREMTEYFPDNDAVKSILHLRMALNELGVKINGLPTIKLSYPNTSLHSRVAQVVQRQWKELLGIMVHLDPFDKPRFFDHISRGQHQMASCLWKGQVQDPIYMLESLGSTSGHNNLTGWKDDQFTRIITNLRNETCSSQIQTLIMKAESYLLEEMPIIPICFGSIYYSKTNRLKNVYVSPLFGVDFTHAYLQDEELRSNQQ